MYDFDAPVNRRGTSSSKWDSPEDPAGMLQMWVADMDFAAPPEVTIFSAAERPQGVPYGSVTTWRTVPARSPLATIVTSLPGVA